MPHSGHPVKLLFDVLLNLVREPGIYIPALVVVAGTFTGAERRIRSGIRARQVSHWPVLPAVIDVVSVVERIVSEKHSGRVYFGTLTYFYRNPELQMGEFERVFPSRAEARQWVDQFKGRSVLVHVNPADSTDSVLRRVDLDGLELHRPSRNLAAPMAINGLNCEDDVREALGPSYRLICGLAELVGMAGLATSAVMLTFSFAIGERLHPAGYYWTCGPMLILAVLAALVLYLHLGRTEQGRHLLRTYTRWAPAWLRWSLKGTSSFFALILPVLHLTRGFLVPIVRPWMHGLMPHLPYLIGSWVFVVITAFFAAVLRSQELVRAPAQTA